MSFNLKIINRNKKHSEDFSRFIDFSSLTKININIIYDFFEFFNKKNNTIFFKILNKYFVNKFEENLFEIYYQNLNKEIDGFTSLMNSSLDAFKNLNAFNNFENLGFTNLLLIKKYFLGQKILISNRSINFNKIEKSLFNLFKILNKKNIIKNEIEYFIINFYQSVFTNNSYYLILFFNKYFGKFYNIKNFLKIYFKDIFYSFDIIFKMIKKSKNGKMIIEYYSLYYYLKGYKIEKKNFYLLLKKHFSINNKFINFYNLLIKDSTEIGKSIIELVKWDKMKIINSKEINNNQENKKKIFLIQLKKLFEIKFCKKKPKNINYSKNNDLLDLIKIKKKFVKIKKKYNLKNFNKLYEDYDFLKILEKLKIDITEFKLTTKILLKNYNIENLINFSKLIKFEKNHILNLLINLLLVLKNIPKYKNDNLSIKKTFSIGSFYFKNNNLTPLFSWIVIYSLKSDHFTLKKILKDYIFPKTIFIYEIEKTFDLIFYYKSKKNNSYLYEIENFSKLRRKKFLENVNTNENIFFNTLEKNYINAYFMLIIDYCSKIKNKESLYIKKCFKLNLIFNNFLWNLERAKDLDLIYFFIRYFLFNFFEKKILDSTHRFNIYLQDVIKAERKFFKTYFQQEIIKKKLKLKFENKMTEFAFYELEINKKKKKPSEEESQLQTSLQNQIELTDELNEEKVYNKNLNLNLFEKFIDTNYIEKSQYGEFKIISEEIKREPYIYNLDYYLWDKEAHIPFENALEPSDFFDFKDSLDNSYFECLLSNFKEIGNKDNISDFLENKGYNQSWIMNLENNQTLFLEFLISFVVHKFKGASEEDFQKYKKILIFLNITNSALKNFPIFEMSFYELYSQIIDLVNLKNCETSKTFSENEKSGIFFITNLVKDDNFFEINSFKSLLKNFLILFPLEKETEIRELLIKKECEKLEKKEDEEDIFRIKKIAENSLLSEKTFNSIGSYNNSLVFVNAKIVDIKNSYFYKFKKGAYYNEIFSDLIDEIIINKNNDIINICTDLYNSLINDIGFENLFNKIQKIIIPNYLECKIVKDVIEFVKGINNKDIELFEVIFKNDILSNAENFFYLHYYLFEKFEINKFNGLCERLKIKNDFNIKFDNMFYSIIFDEKNQLFPFWIESHKSFSLNYESKQLLIILFNSITNGFDSESFIKIGSYLLKDKTNRSINFLRNLSKGLNWKNLKEKPNFDSSLILDFLCHDNKINTHINELVQITDDIFNDNFDFFLNLNEKQKIVFRKYFEISNSQLLSIFPLLICFFSKSLYKQKIKYYLNDFCCCLTFLNIESNSLIALQETFFYMKFLLQKNIKDILSLLNKNGLKKMFCEFFSIFIYICIKQDYMDFSIFPELPELLNMTNKFIFLKSIQKNFIDDKKVYEYINNNLENLYEFIWEFDIELIIELVDLIQKEKVHNYSMIQKKLYYSNYHQFKFEKEFSNTKNIKIPREIKNLYYYFINNQSLFLNFNDLSPNERTKIKMVFIFLEFKNFNEVTPRQIRANPELKLAFGEKNTDALEVISNLSKLIDIKNRIRIYENNIIDILKVSHAVFCSIKKEENLNLDQLIELFYKINFSKDLNKHVKYIEQFNGKKNSLKNIDFNFFEELLIKIQDRENFDLFLYYLKEFASKIKIKETLINRILQKYFNEQKENKNKKKIQTQNNYELDALRDYYHFITEFKTYDNKSFNKFINLLINYTKKEQIDQDYIINTLILLFSKEQSTQIFYNYFFEFQIKKENFTEIFKKSAVKKCIKKTLKIIINEKTNEIMDLYRLSGLYIYFDILICMIFNVMFKITQYEDFINETTDYKLKFFFINFGFFFYICYLVYRILKIQKYKKN